MSEVIIDLEIVEPILLELEPEQPFKVYPDPSPAILKGDKGDKGDTGEQGIQGEKGDKGDKGDKGEQGIQGEKGDKGDKGDKGEQGIQGVPGPQGATGAQGPQGVPGPQGATGATGAQGLKGDTGVIILDSHIGASVTNNELARMRDVRIQAGLLANGDVIQVNIVALHNNTTISKRTRLHLTQSLSTPLSTSNQIAFAVQTTTSVQQQPLNREFIYWNGFVQLLQPSQTGASTDPLANSTNTTEEMVPFNPSIDNWLNISMEGIGQNNYTKTLTRCLIKIIKAS